MKKIIAITLSFIFIACMTLTTFATTSSNVNMEKQELFTLINTKNSVIYSYINTEDNTTIDTKYSFATISNIIENSTINLIGNINYAVSSTNSYGVRIFERRFANATQSYTTYNNTTKIVEITSNTQTYGSYYKQTKAKELIIEGQQTYLTPPINKTTPFYELSITTEQETTQTYNIEIEYYKPKSTEKITYNKTSETTKLSLYYDEIFGEEEYVYINKLKISIPNEINTEGMENDKINYIQSVLVTSEIPSYRTNDMQKEEIDNMFDKMRSLIKENIFGGKYETPTQELFTNAMTYIAITMLLAMPFSLLAIIIIVIKRSTT